MPCNTSTTDSYQLGAAPCSLNLGVTIGYGQNAESTVRVNSTTIGSFTRSFNTVLPNVQVGDELSIVTTVLDITPGNDVTSVTVTLDGGASPKTWWMECDTPGQVSTLYNTTIMFFKP
jgi:hypothetical protein